ncbi:MAG: hypothetical protein GX608_11865 [Lentisphaerae bacterium]|nr:hypothetical protein [Lentisphaerota bacterium]
MNVLLVEPDYKNKFPPLGLLKIGAYHLRKGDTVRLFKGMLKRVDAEYYDRIYICTLFSFYHDKTVKTILHEALAKPLAISAYGGHREGFWKEKMPV